MSVQFGLWNFDGHVPDPGRVAKARIALTPFAPDEISSFAGPGGIVLYGAFHTTKESRSEKQPYVLNSGSVLTWDGRLDNCAELVRQLGGGPSGVEPSQNTSDAAIVGMAYEHWGTDCFAKLLGDWALTVWDPIARSLILAKDPIGTRHLFYAAGQNQITWSTILDLLIPRDRPIKFEEEYIAGWVTLFPAVHLTPFAGIYGVPPSCFVRLRPRTRTTSQYWNFGPGKIIRYRKDEDYEEHFRTIFATSIRRRLRSDRPVLAELSGGMDSSSIICVADLSVAEGLADTPRLDTISYYDDSEPNWNERPYFTKVEEMRGRSGSHIDVSCQPSFPVDLAPEQFAATPGSLIQPSKSARQFSECLSSHGYRILLSGIGGDEVLGGVATPMPELADLMAGARISAFAQQAMRWALASRRPFLHLLTDTVTAFLPARLGGLPVHKQPPVWLDRGFVERNRNALQGYSNRVKLLGPRPSFQDNLSTLDMLRRQLACSSLPSEPHFETRYPYLDRELLEFLYALPPDQIVRPKQRRSLMKRALKDILPPEVLNRTRKGYVSRGPVLSLSSQWSRLLDRTEDMACASYGIVDKQRFRTAMENAKNGNEPSVVPLIRVVAVEDWIRNLAAWGLLGENNEASCGRPHGAARTHFSAENKS